MTAIPRQITTGKVYGYLRLSTDESTQNNSFDVQKTHINTKYHVDKYFTDTLSGSTTFDKRIGWIDLMSTIESGDIIVVHRLDRLSRDTMNYLVVEQSLQKMGVSIQFIEGVNGDDAMSKMIRTVLSAMAEFERSMIATRIKQTMQVMKADGKYLGGAVPYGYTNQDGYLTPDLKEQNIISLMKSKREEGLSYNKIAIFLNDNGYQSRGIKGFTSMSVSRAINYT